MGRLAGKTAVITGGADGIGCAISAGMAREDAHVFISDIDDDRGEHFAAELRNAGHKANYIHCDVALEADVAGLIFKTVQTTGQLDVLVNNAAIAIGARPVYETTDQQSPPLITVQPAHVFPCCHIHPPPRNWRKSHSR